MNAPEQTFSNFPRMLFYGFLIALPFWATVGAVIYWSMK